MFIFRLGYFLLTLILFIVEVLIALYVHDRIIRPYIGDVLVVILIYCFCRSFLRVPVRPLAVCVLLFAFLIEVLQYFQIVRVLGLQDSKIARTVIGVGFEWLDLAAYSVGIVLVLLIEKSREK
jgi:hypothetical protein